MTIATKSTTPFAKASAEPAVSTRRVLWCFALFAWTGLGATSLAVESGPQRFAPDALGQDGRITLTPAFAPDGRTIYFAQSECAPIWECPQQLKRSRFIGGA